MLNMARDMHDNGFWDDNECFCIMCRCLLEKMSIYVRKCRHEKCNAKNMSVHKV